MAAKIIPLVMIQRYGLVNRAVTHKVQSETPLEAVDVEAFRQDADKVLREQEQGAAA